MKLYFHTHVKGAVSQSYTFIISERQTCIYNHAQAVSPLVCICREYETIAGRPPVCFNQCCWKGISPWLGRKKKYSFTVMKETLPICTHCLNCFLFNKGGVGNRYIKWRHQFPHAWQAGQEYRKVPPSYGAGFPAVALFHSYLGSYMCCSFAGSREVLPPCMSFLVSEFADWSCCFNSRVWLPRENYLLEAHQYIYKYSQCWWKVLVPLRNIYSYGR